MSKSVYILNDKGNIPDLAGQAQCKKLTSFLRSVHGFCTNAKGKDDLQHQRKLLAQGLARSSPCSSSARMPTTSSAPSSSARCANSA